MNKTLTAALALSAALLSGCSMTGSGQLRVHEALLYGGTQERIAWIYGNMGSGTASSVKLGGAALDLRAQVQDRLAVPGTLSVNGKATYRLPTSALPPKLSLVRDTAGLFDVNFSHGVQAIYYTDGRTWTRLNGTSGRGVRGTGVTGLRDAGRLTVDEAEALGSALLGQGPLAVAVLNEGEVPDGPLTVEPAPSEYRRTALYVLPGILTVSALGGVTSPAPTPTPGGRVSFSQVASGTNASVTEADVQVATTQAAARALLGLAYGRQTGIPSVPTLSGNETLVGVFLGQRSTGGYSVGVTDVSAQGGILTVTVSLQAPGAGSITTQALTTPWTVIRVPGIYRDVRVVDPQGRPVR
ncbi:protease complex subunit PrcB family protein [Deinococcus hopiensis]|uniref:PrcB C-terminal n=1 Tax=Deinococcus hopiensis KR-140 TaxID=695939 RepID=A0A1W1VDG6_9DEIO|nr:protease complex subunit PrcB family protein [Deinococcus hopiensis]SMB91366.1 PrcB C-terminal [Deinococcus hopiensis KR-140]